MAPAAEEMPDESGDMGWARFDEESVMHERRQSLARTQKAKALVSKQEAVLQGILKKMVEEEDSGAISPSASDAFSKAGSSQRFRSWSSFSRPSQSATTSASFQEASTFDQQAWTVAKQILTRQEKKQAFWNQRKEHFEEARHRSEQRQIEREAAEARFAERQREIADEHRRRAFAAQQRRSEQQKVFRETLREQDRVCDEYYKNASPRGSRSGAQTARSSPRHEKLESNEADIYRHMLQSHDLYSETVDRWRQQVAENDRRAEAFRRRMLKARTGSRLREERNGTKKEESRKSLRKGALALVSLPDKVQGESRRGSAHSQPSEVAGEEKVTGMSRSMPCLREGREGARGKGLVRSKTVEQWNRRFQNVLSFSEELEQKAYRKQQQQEKNLEEGRRRIAAINKQVIMRAADRTKKWKERNDAAASRRQLNAVTSDADMVAKLAAGFQRKAELEKQRADELAEASASKWAQIESAQAAAALLLDKSEKALISKVQQRDHMVAERHAMRLQEFAARADTGGPYQEQAEHAKSRKKELEEEFRLKAMKEMEMKSSRHKGDSGPVLERQRTLKKMRTFQRQHTELPADLPFPRSLEDEDELVAGMSHQVRPGESSLGLPLALESKSGPARRLSRSSPGKRVSVASVADSMASMDDEDAEKAILQDLEQRSSNWMKEMRRQKESRKKIV
mmetsp:Transcript_35455/g.81809  ORF Transcript_35455/g.81809 Transcript_35455/m.81809 type:complete len:684 (+) Transcript_35455:76-2127(+)